MSAARRPAPTTTSAPRWARWVATTRRWVTTGGPWRHSAPWATALREIGSSGPAEDAWRAALDRYDRPGHRRAAALRRQPS